MNPNPPLQSIQEQTGKAQLRKLELEIQGLEHDNWLKAEKSGQERQKLDLEISSLKRQNNLFSRLAQGATVITILATFITAVATAWGFYTAYNQYFKAQNDDLNLKAKEARDRASTQYRTELQQLLTFPTDPKQTIPTEVFLLHDLHDVIENGFVDIDREARKREVGFLLAQLMRSAEFDPAVNRNSEYDRKAMNYSEHYATFLIDNPTENLDIISKYKDVLGQLRKADPRFYETLTVSQNDYFTIVATPKSGTELTQYVFLFQAYKKHVDLLNRALEKHPGDTELQRKINFAFCWFYDSTRNKSLTSNIFGVKESDAEQMSKTICEEPASH